MTMRFPHAGAIAGVLSILLMLPLQSEAASAGLQPAKTASAPETVWVYPVIKGFGRVHPRPDAAVQPDPAADYKVIVDVVHGSKDHHEALHSLQRLARVVNLMGLSRVPPSHVHIVAVLEGEAGYAALGNAQYRKAFKTDNPNLPILHALKQAGVRLLVCGQAMAEMHLQDTDVGPDITVSLSALSDFVVYGQRGYSYLQL
ncbi:MAG TPA: DsrE family protein [Rhodanobacter sp.]|nr:DsrE family protein [Rhodanobacter sp.]